MLENEDRKVLLINTDANDTKRELTPADATLETLGIKDFEVTGDFDIKTLDKVLQYISGGRSDCGVQSNSYDYAININETTKHNIYVAKSTMMDTEYGEYVGQLKK